MILPRSASHVLPDGRTLRWHDYGDPTGIPCVYVPGTPSSGLAGLVYSDAAEAAGVRLVSVDKPGYGGSSHQRSRTLLGFAADIASLADSLGLRRFAVLGESGGGPHALAAARALPERLTLVLVAAGMGPADQRWVRDGMKPDNRRLMALARRAPWLLRLPMALTRRQLLAAGARERLVARALEGAGPADARCLRELSAQYDVTVPSRDALRAGGRAAAQELGLLARPWGFDPSDIACPVELWHGEEDVNVPVAVTVELARQIPGATAHVLPGEGHAVAWARRADLMSAVVRAGERCPA